MAIRGSAVNPDASADYYAPRRTLRRVISQIGSGTALAQQDGMALITLWTTDHANCVLQLAGGPAICDKTLVLIRDGVEVRRRAVSDRNVLSVSDRWRAEMARWPKTNCNAA
jgi:hypothetical protein